MNIKNKNFGFTIIETLIAIFIFAMAMASIFMVINGSLNANNLSKQQIIASNLAREQIEIIRNLRDNNYATFHKYNWIPNSSNNFFKVLQKDKYYKVENDFADANYNYLIKDDGNQSFTNDFKQDLKDGKFDSYKVFIDSNHNYTYNNSGTGTIYYKFVKIEELKDDSGNIINNALKIKSKVIWYYKGYHEFEIPTILADFNRL